MKSFSLAFTKRTGWAKIRRFNELRSVLKNSMQLKQPLLDSLLQQQKENYKQLGWHAGKEIRQVVSPYRICPLGAHVDHQGGKVLGRTINAYSILTFSPSVNGEVRMRSEEFSGQETFAVEQLSFSEQTPWGRYLRGAADVLMKETRLKNGIRGQVLGSLPGGGLSSSASVGLAYLHALAFVNQINMSDWEAIELDRKLENDFLGLANGILDQSMIQLGRRGQMLYLDTFTLEHDWTPDPSASEDTCFFIVYSGFSRALVSTGFNDRVGECRQAARQLGEMSGNCKAQILSDVSVETHEQYRHNLPAELRKRAAHYYSEVARVVQGRQAWVDGNLVKFGELMNESCHSSITQYESGSEPIIQLHEIVSGASGVLGSRFGGGGYGGCVIGLVPRNQLEKAAGEIQEAYLQLYPEMKDVMIIFEVEDEGGVRVV